MFRHSFYYIYALILILSFHYSHCEWDQVEKRGESIAKARDVDDHLKWFNFMFQSFTGRPGSPGPNVLQHVCLQLS